MAAVECAVGEPLEIVPFVEHDGSTVRLPTAPNAGFDFRNRLDRCDFAAQSGRCGLEFGVRRPAAGMGERPGAEHGVLTSGDRFAGQPAQREAARVDTAVRCQQGARVCLERGDCGNRRFVGNACYSVRLR